MAKLKALPGMKIVSGFKGVIDYYIWMGIPCARRWPRSPGTRRAPLVMAQYSTWSYAAKLWAHMPTEIQDAYRSTTAGTNLSGRDLSQKAYVSGYFKA